MLPLLNDIPPAASVTAGRGTEQGQTGGIARVVHKNSQKDSDSQHTFLSSVVTSILHV
jgi:hypothetical protein